MSTEVVEIMFVEQSHYERNKDAIKAIIKGDFGLAKFDFGQNRWIGKDPDNVEVKRLVQDEKTWGLRVKGYPELAAALLAFTIEHNLNVEVSTPKQADPVVEYVNTHTAEYDRYVDNRVERGELEADVGEQYKRLWKEAAERYYRTTKAL